MGVALEKIGRRCNASLFQQSLKFEKHSHIVFQIFGFDALKAHEITEAEIVGFEILIFGR